MRKIFCAGFALGMSFLAIGCSSGDSDNGSPQASGESASGPAWSLTLQSICVPQSESQCIAKHGFTVSADGKYRVGPGPKQQVMGGQLSESELTELNAKLQAVLASARFGAEGGENHASGIENESNDTLSLERQGKTEVVLRNTADEYAFATASLDEAKALHDAIRGLAATYYRLPFGSDCADAALSVEALYAGLQGCQVDSDCVYVDADRGYSVIAPSTEQWIFADDCTAIRPMTVANKSAVLAGAAALQAAYGKAAEACGEEFNRANYSTCYYDQKSTATAPQCVQNRCQARF